MKRGPKLSTRLVPCPVCEGTGLVNNAEPCKFCQGEGKIRVLKRKINAENKTTRPILGN